MHETGGSARWTDNPVWVNAVWKVDVRSGRVGRREGTQLALHLDRRSSSRVPARPPHNTLIERPQDVWQRQRAAGLSGGVRLARAHGWESLGIDYRGRQAMNISDKAGCNDSGERRPPMAT